MNNFPLISIGITTYNRVEMVSDLINKFLNQEYFNIEILLGNDYQDKLLTNESLNIYDKRLKIFNHQHNLGELNNLNFLLEKSNGTYFTWHFDDDSINSLFLKSVSLAIVDNSFPKCILTNFEYIYNNEPIKNRDFKIEKINHLSGIKIFNLYTERKIHLCSLAGVYDTNYLKSLGGVKRLSSGHMALYSEYLLIVQLSNLDKIIYLDHPLVYNRIHDGGFSANSKDYILFREAGFNLVKESIDLLVNQNSNNFKPANLTYLLDISLSNFVVRSSINPAKNYKSFINYIKDFENLFNNSRYILIKDNCFCSLKTSRKKYYKFYIKSLIKHTFGPTQLRILREILNYK